MGFGIFPEVDEGAIYLSRSNPDEVLGTFSQHTFRLEDEDWPSVEHYYQATKFENAKHREKIRAAGHPKIARKLGRSRLKRLRKDWSSVKEVVMTRGVYTKCREHHEVAEALLATGDSKIVENSQYDYFWGCGRDRRGKNTYGRVLMNVRARLLAEKESK